MSLLVFMDTLCNVERETPTPDAVGANVPTFSARLSNIPCSVQGVSTTAAPLRNMAFSREDSTYALVVHTAVPLNATTQDRVKILAGPFAGTYPVVGSSVAANAMITSEVLYSTFVVQRNLGG